MPLLVGPWGANRRAVSWFSALPSHSQLKARLAQQMLFLHVPRKVRSTHKLILSISDSSHKPYQHSKPQCREVLATDWTGTLLQQVTLNLYKQYKWHRQHTVLTMIPSFDIQDCMLKQTSEKFMHWRNHYKQSCISAVWLRGAPCSPHNWYACCTLLTICTGSVQFHTLQIPTTGQVYRPCVRTHLICTCFILLIVKLYSFSVLISTVSGTLHY